MIIVKLMGGMGNQMFQYALGRNLSLKYNVPLKIDLSFLNRRDFGPNFTYRNYDLDIFNIFEDFDLSNVGKILTIKEPHFHYYENILNLVDNLLKQGNSVLLDGYWQSPFYFKEYESQIKKDFEFKDNVINSEKHIVEMLNKITSCDSVLVNIRRTDYLNNNFHGVMGIDYINQAKNIIESIVKTPHYFIFSDDIDWCKENIHINNMTIVDHTYKGNKFNYYLQLMKNCKYCIIPNSSFAWWSSWMNTFEEKIIITPKQWFNDKNINTNDLIPSNWIRI